LVAVTSPNLNVALEDLKIRQMALRTPPGGGGVKGLVTRAARVSHSSTRAAVHTTASPALYMCALPRKAALRSKAAMASMMNAHFSCGNVSQTLLMILE
jgi:hypothetical protein